ncbi:Adenylyltransferase and sulfurtransferase MOCS3 [Linum perenne]
MESSNRGDAASIIAEIESLKSAKSDIDLRIRALEAQLRDLNLQKKPALCSNGSSHYTTVDSAFPHGLSPDMVYRYSRHLLLSSFGVQGQSNLVKSSILVVGAGGLGAPALLYLAASGVGRLGIVDHDIVELNNMHRQVIHTEGFIGQPKVTSAASACRAYDIVVDATDNAPSRYMISDCCVVLGKPLVSGAALGMEGQLTVYNHNGGPCYRCLFPTPPPTTACQRCSDNGVLGVVPGIIGCLQALEAIKIASSIGEPLSGRMLLLDALSARVRIVKIRGRASQCKVCGDNTAFTKEEFKKFDYEKFTQSPLSPAPLKLNLLAADCRISSSEFHNKVRKGEAYVLIDVRPAHHFKIVSLPNALNIPLASMEARLADIKSALEEVKRCRGSGPESAVDLYVMCRRGNDSQRAVELLQKMGFPSAKDIVGGLEGWAREVDPNLPTY